MAFQVTVVQAGEVFVTSNLDGQVRVFQVQWDGSVVERDQTWLQDPASPPPAEAGPSDSA